MLKGNILVLGNSGVGKSTLINAVLGEDAAPTGWGVDSVTKEVRRYGGDNSMFYLVDSIGFQPDKKGSDNAVGAVKKWSAAGMKKGGGDNAVDMVWLCVDGTSRKLFPQTLEYFSKATAMWKNVPVIVVITKSYSETERNENVLMVNNAFAISKNISCNLKAVIPVVAKPYFFTETMFAPPYGISELIDRTMENMREGIDNSGETIASVRLKSKRIGAQLIIAGSVASAVAACAIPVPLADSAMLVPIELAEIRFISGNYEIKNDKIIEVISESIIAGGAATVAARTALSALKAIPGLNIAAAVLNSVVGGSMAALIGECTVFICEQQYLHNRDVENDPEWVRSAVNEKFGSSEIISRVTEIAESIGGSKDNKNITSAIIKAFTKKDKK